MTPLPPLSALRALAEAATPGPWKDESEARSGNWCRVFSGEKYGAGQTIAQWTMPADARYIAAFSPSTTLALLARIEELEAACEVHRQIGIYEERLSVAKEKLAHFNDLARGGAFVTGTYDMRAEVERLGERLAALRALVSK